MTENKNDDVGRRRLQRVIVSAWFLGWICIVVGAFAFGGWKIAALLLGLVLLFHAVTMAHIANRDDEEKRR